ncbi:MAG: glycosyltransferase family 4 protein [Pseudomonadota bacterium]
MKILALTHYYPPEVNAPASRMSEHAKAWQAAGHEVTIVTCAPNHPAGTLYPGYRNRFYQEELVDGIRVIRLWTWLAANEGFLPRIANYLSYFMSVFVWMWRLPKADIVLSTSPQFFCGLAGALFQRRARPWVLEIRDLWPESIVAVGAMKRSRIVRLLEAIEGWAYRKADLVVPVTDGFVHHIRKDRQEKPIAVIKNGVDLQQFATADRQAVAAFREKHGLGERFIAAYVGTHGMAHGLDIILDAAERLRNRPDIVFLTVGDGAERKRLEADCAQRGLSNVMILGQQPKAMMPVVWGASDAALVLLRKSDTFKTVIPSKIFEAMALRCPIILGVEGEALELVASANAGLPITPGDSRELADAVIRLTDDQGLCERIGSDARAFVEQNFERRVLAMRYLDLMAQTVGQKR